ncbi:MAG: hypothetical protein Fues2KO_32640 [Fuerstiella sp.]
MSASDLPALNVVETNRDSFVCPGEMQAISGSVHRARMAAGWHACLACQHSAEAEQDTVKNQFSREPHASSDSKESHNPLAIYRSPAGVRGAWLNAIDRAVAATLATEFARQLQQQIYTSKETATQDRVVATADGEFDDAIRRPAPIRIAVGYDDNAGSVDLFAGVLPALRRCGWSVVDAGRCTAGSLLNLCRQRPEVDGCILLTGSGGRSGDVGMDVFNADGQPMSISWQDAGIGVRMAADTGCEQSDPDPIRQRLQQIRSTQTQRLTARPAEEEPSRTHRHNDAWAELILPDRLRLRQQRNRIGRASGTLSSFAAEPLYRNWLLRWWPVSESFQSGPTRLRIAANNVQTRQHLAWLQQQRPTEFILADEEPLQRLPVRMASHTASSVLPSEAPPVDIRTGLQVAIEADDRLCHFRDQFGRVIPPAAVADWINESPRTVAQHMTAHVTADPVPRVVLVDAAPPHGNRSHDIVSDALAVLGLICSIRRCGNVGWPTA